MGLDMYLSAKKNVEKVVWSALRDNEQLSYDSPEAVNPLWKNIVDVADMADVATDIYGVNIEVVCGYWRKANQIHNWFVNNIQKGNDNCGEYYVSQSQLQELLDLVNKALDNKDPNLLPPKDGFFFGGTDIDEWYWQDLKNTKAQLERIFALPQLSDLSFYYSSSWQKGEGI